MKIILNSRRVDALHLKIYAGECLLFNDFVYSKPKNEIEIRPFEGDMLKFQWSFCMTRAERKALEKRTDRPEWGVSAYDDKDLFNAAGCDYIYDHACPIPAKGLYAAVINGLTPDEPTLHLMFRRSGMNRDLPLLYIMNRQEREKFSVIYERTADAEFLLQMTKKVIHRRTAMKTAEMLLILMGAYFLEVYRSKRYILYPLIFLVCYIAQSQFRLLKYYRSFLRQVEQYPRFKEEKGKIEAVQ